MPSLRFAWALKATLTMLCQGMSRVIGIFTKEAAYAFYISKDTATMQAKPFEKTTILRHWIIGFILVAVLACIGLWLFFSEPDDSEQQSLVDASAKIEYGDIEENVTAQGKLEPKEFVDVGAQVTGQLQKLHVEIGDAVKAGELLAEIDPRIYAARVKADEARINTLKAQLVEQEAQILFASRQFVRNKLMFKTKAVSQEA